jgi:hypothetical protein
VRDVLRKSIWLAVVSGLLLSLATGCGGGEPSTPSASSSPPEAEAAVAVPLPPELAGSWVTSKWLDQTGSQQILRTYVFSPDGGYEYTIAMCRSSTDCSVVSQESGLAQAAGGMLSLEPRTESEEGPRSWPYVVGQDPNVGDIQLHLTLSGGQLDIFYRG